jgi:hypothetical protein
MRQVGRLRTRGWQTFVAATVLLGVTLAITVVSSTAANDVRRSAVLDRYTFRGNGGKTLPPLRIRLRSTLYWSATGGLFQIFNNSGSSGGDVNSQASHGATYMPPGRYKLQVNAIGSWVIKISPGIERPQRIGSNVGFRGNGGRTLPPFRTRGGRTLYWRAKGGLFQLFSSGLNGPDVNSQASHGTTYMDGGTHQVTVNATKAWVIYWRP